MIEEARFWHTGFISGLDIKIENPPNVITRHRETLLSMSMFDLTVEDYKQIISACKDGIRHLEGVVLAD